MTANGRAVGGRRGARRRRRAARAVGASAWVGVRWCAGRAMASCRRPGDAASYGPTPDERPDGGLDGARSRDGPPRRQGRAHHRRRRAAWAGSRPSCSPPRARAVAAVDLARAATRRSRPSTAAGRRGHLASPPTSPTRRRSRRRSPRPSTAFGGLHVLYNNAGVSLADDDGADRPPPEETWDTTMDVNVKGVWLLLQGTASRPCSTAAAARSSTSPSFVAHLGAATPQLAYTTSKGAVLAMTREIAVDLRPRRASGPTPCARARCSPRCWPSSCPTTAKRQRRLVHIPMGRFGEAEEMVNGALFLASDESSFMTGQSLAHRRRHHRRLHHARSEDQTDGTARHAARRRRAARSSIADGERRHRRSSCFPDLQGRLMGKRVIGRFFRDHVLDGTHRGLQLPARRRRRHDAAARLPLRQLGAGLRRLQRRARPGDAAARAVAREDRARALRPRRRGRPASPVEVSPRRILQRQIERAAELGLPR